MRLGARYGQGDWLSDVVGSSDQFAVDIVEAAMKMVTSVGVSWCTVCWAIPVWLVDELAVRYSQFGSVYR